MKIIALIDDGKVIEKILKHLGLWIGYESARAPPEQGGGYTYEPCIDSSRRSQQAEAEDPMPDYESENQTSAVA